MNYGWLCPNTSSAHAGNVLLYAFPNIAVEKHTCTIRTHTPPIRKGVTPKARANACWLSYLHIHIHGVMVGALCSTCFKFCYTPLQ